MDAFDEFISAVQWKYAKSMPTAPHEYIVRWDYPERDSTFCEFARYIRANGHPGRFFRMTFTYFMRGGFKYWTMGDPIHDDPEEARRNILKTTYILNRAKLRW